jgi:hypothetical protein
MASFAVASRYANIIDQLLMAFAWLLRHLHCDELSIRRNLVAESGVTEFDMFHSRINEHSKRCTSWTNCEPCSIS